MNFRLSITILLFSGVTFAQNSLPIFRTSWNDETPTSWTDWGTSSYVLPFSCSEGNSGKLQNEGDYFEVNFSEAPDQLSFVLKGDLFNNGELSIQESVNGVDWTNCIVYNELKDECKKETLYLNKASRYVRFYYSLKAKGSILLDDVSISKSLTGNSELVQN